MSTRALAAVVALGLSLSACGDKVTVNDTKKGKAGESCTRSDDCEESLSCIEGRCATAQSVTEEEGGMPQASGGKPGESCTRRADCQTGLVCIDQVCVEDSTTLHNDAGISPQRGDRGETCSERADCQIGLTCISGICSDGENPFSVQTKQCFSVECSADADCCKTFTPSTLCASYKTTCESTTALASEKMAACQQYNSGLCQCQRVCDNAVCANITRCSTDTQCFGLVCANNRCVQCNTKTDCAQANAECVDHVCKVGCTRNEECPLFFNCTAGKCAYAGCTSDRECYFASKDFNSKCENKECVTQCASDGECKGPFDVCDKGRCIDVGCESDAECRVQLNIQNQTTTGRTAVCKLPPAK